MPLLKRPNSYRSQNSGILEDLEPKMKWNQKANSLHHIHNLHDNSVKHSSWFYIIQKSKGPHCTKEYCLQLTSTSKPNKIINKRQIFIWWRKTTVSRCMDPWCGTCPQKRHLLSNVAKCSLYVPICHANLEIWYIAWLVPTVEKII